MVIIDKITFGCNELNRMNENGFYLKRSKSLVVDYMKKKVYVEVLHHSSFIKLNLTLAIEKGRYLLIM